MMRMRSFRNGIDGGGGCRRWRMRRQRRRFGGMSRRNCRTSQRGGWIPAVVLPHEIQRRVDIDPLRWNKDGRSGCRRSGQPQAHLQRRRRCRRSASAGSAGRLQVHVERMRRRLVRQHLRVQLAQFRRGRSVMRKRHRFLTMRRKRFAGSQRRRI